MQMNHNVKSPSTRDLPPRTDLHNLPVGYHRQLTSDNPIYEIDTISEDENTEQFIEDLQSTHFQTNQNQNLRFTPEVALIPLSPLFSPFPDRGSLRNGNALCSKLYLVTRWNGKTLLTIWEAFQDSDESLSRIGNNLTRNT